MPNCLNDKAFKPHIIQVTRNDYCNNLFYSVLYLFRFCYKSFMNYINVYIFAFCELENT